jgi:hypothetical protein
MFKDLKQTGKNKQIKYLFEKKTNSNSQKSDQNKYKYNSFFKKLICFIKMRNRSKGEKK